MHYILSIPFFAIKIWRWKFILYRIGIDYPFYNSVKTYGAGLFLGQMTPGQIGEMVRGSLLSNRGYHIFLATVSVIFYNEFY